MVPKLRFKEFYGEWEEKRLGDVCQVFGRIGFRGYTTKDIVKKEEGVISLSPSNIVDSKLFLEKENTYISYSKYEESPEIKVYNGDIIFVKTGSTFGKVAIVENLNKNATLNPQMIVLKNITCNNRFLNYVISMPVIQKQVQMAKGGGVVPTLTQKEFLNYKFKLPSLQEQTKIADFLSTVDDKIQNQQDKITHLENIKKGFMQKIFSRKIRFKDDGGDEFPEWEEKKLGDIVNIYKGNTLSKIDLRDEGKPCILYGELYTKYGEIINKVYSKTNRNDKKLFIGKSNDVLIPSSGETAIDISTASCLKCNNAYIGGDLNVIRCSDMLNGEFLSYTLNYKQRNSIAKLSQGISIVHLYGDSLKKLKIEVPCLKEQQKIADFLSSFNEKIYTEKEILEHLKQLKKGLLQQMFV